MSSGQISLAGRAFESEACLEEREEEIPRYSDAGTKGLSMVFFVHVST